jgi:AcrR family transcriptional regulator
MRYTVYTVPISTSHTTQARVFAAARQLFDEGGVEAVSMRRIAEKVGITAMAIYKHYPDKDALLNVLMLDGFAAWEARVEKIREAEPLAWLLRLDDEFLEFALNEPRRYEAAFLLKASAARRYPEDFLAGRSPVVSKVLARIEEARALGLIGDIPAIDVAIAFGALSQGLVSLYRAGRFTGEAEFRDAYHRALGHCRRAFLLEKSS